MCLAHCSMCFLRLLPFKSQRERTNKKSILYSKLYFFAFLAWLYAWTNSADGKKRKKPPCCISPSISLALLHRAIIGETKNMNKIHSDTEKMFHFHFAFLYGNADTWAWAWASLSPALSWNARNCIYKRKKLVFFFGGGMNLWIFVRAKFISKVISIYCTSLCVCHGNNHHESRHM